MRTGRIITSVLFGSVLMGASALAGAVGVGESVSAEACKSWMGETFFLLNRGESGYSTFFGQCVDKLKSVRADGECGGACSALYKSTFNVNDRAFTQAFSEGCVKQCTNVVEKVSKTGASSPVALQ